MLSVPERFSGGDVSERPRRASWPSATTVAHHGGGAPRGSVCRSIQRAHVGRTLGCSGHASATRHVPSGKRVPELGA